MVQDEFFIGWSSEMPKAAARVMKSVVYALVILIPLTAVLVVLSQPAFVGSRYEIATTTELVGHISLEPAPFLTLEKNGQLLLLVGPGKLGGKEFVLKQEKKSGFNLINIPVSVRGKLIYRDGKTAFELASVTPITGDAQPEQTAEALGEVTLTGEITDPKCMLGVMKPGEGITHRECAIRCIAGGITPTLKVTNQAGESEYYLLCDQDGSSINECLLPFVGVGVEVSGSLKKKGDWLILYLNPEKLRKVNKLTFNAPMCHQ
jgi:hypothetical protein